MSALTVMGVLLAQFFIAFLWFWVGYSYRQREERELRDSARYLEAVRRAVAADVPHGN